MKLPGTVGCYEKEVVHLHQNTIPALRFLAQAEGSSGWSSESGAPCGAHGLGRRTEHRAEM